MGRHNEPSVSLIGRFVSRKLGAMLIDRSPQQIRLAAQRHKDLVQMPCGGGLATPTLPRH
jgi:hypothetical protein